ncbi:hypothetical protein CJE1120 [Campylobacter jejuni RM1221]|nr:hypothetical protein CJE1120 [Campylobacter jejuni RM1221]
MDLHSITYFFGSEEQAEKTQAVTTLNKVSLIVFFIFNPFFVYL